MTCALDGIQVLDLTTHRGNIAGRLLADLGAEVVKIDSPYGTQSKHLPPFASDGTSLYWAAYEAGKTIVNIDYQSTRGREQLVDLASRADVLIECFEPGLADSLKIGYESLRRTNPGLIYAAITPFGQHGPKSQWPATDLTTEAAGGRISLQGDLDRPPLPVGYPQAFLHAGAQIAADITVALNERDVSGLGQFLDHSAQEAMWWTLMGAQGNPVCSGTDPIGVGDDRAPRQRGQGTQMVEAKDGWITMAPGATPRGSKSMFSFALEEAISLGESVDGLDQYDWNDWIPQYRAGEIQPEHLQSISGFLRKFIQRRTKLELVQWALENNLRLGPLHTTRDLIDFPQFVERGVFRRVNGFLQPAVWAKFSRTPLRQRETSRSKADSIDWQPRPNPPKSTNRTGLAFEGLRVADFSWVAAGPTVSKCLADHGATVVKIESKTRPDLSRSLDPFVGNEPGLNRSYWSYLYATSKLSLECNLSTEGGRSLARRVCDWADVVVESFSPGTLKRMGLDYEMLSKDRDDLIMFSTSMLGQTGTYRRYAGFGQQTAGFSGLHYITGWPDRVPCGVATPYTDVVAPKFGIASLAAALLERRRSGLGQHIDLAQGECSMLFLAPLVLDETANRRTAQAQGFDSMYACPQGIYQCSGTQRYIAIATESNKQWERLANFIPEFQYRDESYSKFEERWEHRAEINESIAKWTADQDAFELESRLAENGVPASVVMRPTDVYSDPHIEDRGFKQELHQTECGNVVHFGFPTRFSARKQMVRTAPPNIGEHNDYVMNELLGLKTEEIQALRDSGAID